MTTATVNRHKKRTKPWIDDQWENEAACRTEDPELFFTNDEQTSRNGSGAIKHIRAAKAICARCPVAGECLAYALRMDERYGVWGGLSEREREKLGGKKRDWLKW